MKKAGAAPELSFLNEDGVENEKRWQE